MTVTLDDAQDVLAAQPFSGLVGARLTTFEEGRAVLEIDVDGRHRQQFGLVHGGVLAYAADNAITFAAGTVLGAGVVTGGFTINYVQGARDGVLRAAARVAHHNSRQAVCTCEIEQIAADGTGTLCAVAQGTVVATRRYG